MSKIYEKAVFALSEFIHIVCLGTASIVVSMMCVGGVFTLIFWFLKIIIDLWK
jgi:hypothetical protein